MPGMSKAERISRQKMTRYLYEHRMGENDISLELRDKVPQAWHTLEHDLDVEEPKVKVTLRLETSVARFYRAMGPGYQARMKICDMLRLEGNIANRWRSGTPRTERPRRKRRWVREFGGVRAC